MHPQTTRFRTLGLLLAVALLAACSSPGRLVALDLGASTALDEVLRAAVHDASIPGVVALVTDRDRILYQGAFGEMDEARFQPMRPDAIFQIFSMTKPVTSLGVMMLVEDGLVSLDDPVSYYLGEFEDRPVLVSVDAYSSAVRTRPPTRSPTVRDLLRHTSGIGYAFSSYELQDWVAATGRPVLEQPLLHDPGDRWTYGASTYFLGRIIEEVTGEPLDRYLSSRVFMPLGMTDTGFGLPAGKRGRLVALHQRHGTRLEPVPRPQEYQPEVRGDSGLLSTAQDYSRFVRLILGEGELDGVRLLSAASIAEMTNDQLPGITVTLQPGALPELSSPFPIGAGRDGFGLGFQVSSGESAGRAPGSLSWAGLRNTHFWVDPGNGIGVVFLTQVLPFYDESVIRTLVNFERTLYHQLDATQGRAKPDVIRH